MAYALLDLVPQLGVLRLVLPPATLAWRLELLKQGGQWISKRFGQVGAGGGRRRSTGGAGPGAQRISASLG
jgi:hypothetical protein